MSNKRVRKQDFEKTDTETYTLTPTETTWLGDMLTVRAQLAAQVQARDAAVNALAAQLATNAGWGEVPSTDLELSRPDPNGPILLRRRARKVASEPSLPLPETPAPTK